MTKPNSTDHSHSRTDASISEPHRSRVPKFAQNDGSSAPREQSILRRRRFLQTASFGIMGATLTGSAAASDHDGSEPSIAFEDQQTGGSSITVAEVVTDVDTTLHVADAERDILATRRLNAGETITDLVVDLNESISESQEMEVFIVDTAEGDLSATAWVSVGEAPDNRAGMEPTLIEPKPDAGFNYPYLLRAPSKSTDDTPVPPLVEPTNTGRPSDDIDDHIEAGKQTLESGVGRRVSDQLTVPFIVPIFPRPERNPVDWNHYVHQLDDTTMEINNGPLERVDLQLLNMVEHAREQLHGQDYPLMDEGMLLNGFSASGNFVDRFTVLHPEEVISVTAGGLNGMALLPLEEADGHELPYHVGIADVEDLTGKPPDLDALNETNQFLYMGAEDDNDTIPYDDAWTDDDLRQLALDVYGEGMVTERFPRCQRAYREAGIDAQFRIYEGVGHSPRAALEDIITFHRRSIADEDVSDLGQNIVPEVVFTTDPEVPTVGEEVRFDASSSDTVNEEIIAVEWDLGDGETATGKTATHTFSDSGEYTIGLRITSSGGTQRSTTETVTVSDREERETDANGGSSGEERETETSDSTTNEDEKTDTDDADTGTVEEQPGLGVGSAVAALGGLGYVVKRRLGSQSDNQ